MWQTYLNMTINPGSTIGIIGGGQLGRMTSLAAANLGYKTHIFSPEENCPAGHYCDQLTVADYDDLNALKAFANSVDVVTFEFENIPHKSISFLEEHAIVRPGFKALEISQNRLKEKDFINSLNIKTAPYARVENTNDLIAAFSKTGTEKAVLKTTELGYDGKGQVVITRQSDLGKVWQDSAMSQAILEGFIPFEKEISVIIARQTSGKSLCFPPAENQHVNGILDVSSVPANIEQRTHLHAKEYTTKIADALGLVGLLAVEFFVLKDGSLLVNEIAPRPHNSGHWTMDGCVTSQFEQFVRAVCDIPLGSTDIVYPTVMKNLIGKDVEKWSSVLGEPNAKLHLYGKNEARKGRKMGHVNYIQSTLDDLK